MTRPSPSTVTDEGLVLSIAKAMCGEMYGPLEGGSWAVLGAHGKDSLVRCAKAMLEASGHTALLRENAVLREALRNISLRADEPDEADRARSIILDVGQEIALQLGGA